MAEDTQRLKDWEVVTVALYHVGGHRSRAYTEHVAEYIRSSMPGRFRWRFFDEHVNLEQVRRSLSKASSNDCRLVIGSHKLGWMLTQIGAEFAEANLEHTLDAINSQKNFASTARERSRILESGAWESLRGGNAKAMSKNDAMELLRLSPYVRGAPRLRKVAALITMFRTDKEILPALLRAAATLEISIDGSD